MRDQNLLNDVVLTVKSVNDYHSLLPEVSASIPILLSPPRSRLYTCWNNITHHPKFWGSINLIYSVWASTVFALLSFFRPKGSNNFTQDMTVSNVAEGVFFASCSFMVNVPMAYYFSSEFLRFFASVFNRCKTEKRLTLPLGIILFLGGTTTIAASALSYVSLAEWSDGFLYPTLVFFMWNVFTTRTKGLITRFTLIWDYFQYPGMIQRLDVMRIVLWARCGVIFDFYCDLALYAQHVPFFPALISVPEVSDSLIQNKKLQWRETQLRRAYYFYNQLQPNKVQEQENKFPLHEELRDSVERVTQCLKEQENTLLKQCKVSDILQASVGVGLIIFLLNSFYFWRSLGEKGVHELGIEKGKSFFVWVCACSNLLFYAECVWKAADIFREIFVRRLGGVKVDRSWQRFVTIFFLYCVVATLSGAGYSEAAKKEVESGNTEALYLQKGFTTWYFYLMTGLLVNGTSVILWCLNYMPEGLRQWVGVPELFIPKVEVQEVQKDLQKFFVQEASFNGGEGSDTDQLRLQELRHRVLELRSRYTPRGIAREDSFQHVLDLAR